jgi:hypothetical protein
MSTLFDLSALLVMPIWLMMIVVPRWCWTERVVASPLVSVLPALLYAALVLPRLGDVFPAVLSPTLATIAPLLGSPAGATIAWAHFLAFDLFVGRWIFLDARERSVSAWVLAPLLFLPLMLGPLGFLLYLGVRAVTGPRAGASGPTQPPAWRRAAQRGRDTIAQFARRQPILFWVGAAHLALYGVFLALVPFDARTVLGISPWIKPSKFAISIAVYLFTIAWFIDHLALSRRAHRVVSWSLASAMLLEMALIAFQAARGTTSHFNQTSPFNAAVFGIMGAAITYSAAIALYILVKYFRTPPALPRAYIWGIRLGLLIFLLANLEGFVMAFRLAHSVGVPDGGAGLPYTNWSTAGGDLRVAHFIGLHALQAVPLAGWALARLGAAGRVARPEMWLRVFAALYGLAALLLFAQALAGRPLLQL